MGWPPLFISLAVVAIWIACSLPFWKRFAPYARRGDAGPEWLGRFPDAALADVRAFLRVFVDAFAIGRRHAAKFKPDDVIMDVYRALNPRGWTSGDFAEWECFAVLLKRRYGITLDAVFPEDVTLGEVFAKARSR